MTTFNFSVDPLIRYPQVETRMKNQSFYIIFTGAGGSGKSYGEMEYLRLIDPMFNVDRIAFSEEEFVDLLKKKFPPGSAIMWDEAGVGLDSREFMTLINKVMSYVTMTMRYRRQVIGLTVPDMGWIDIKTRKMLHAYVELQKKFINNRSIGKYHVLETNYRYGKTYHKAPVVMKDGIPYIIQHVEFNKPPQDLIDAYEKRKDVFGDQLLEDVSETIARIKQKKQRKLSDDDIIEYVRNNRLEFTTLNKLDIRKISLKFGLSRHGKQEIAQKLHAANLMRGKSRRT